LSSVGMADEQPVFLADAGWSDRVFDQIIVQSALAMMQMGAQRRPLVEQIGAGATEQRLGQDAGLHPLRQSMQTVHRAGQAIRGVAFFGPRDGQELLFVPGAFAPIHPGDEAQEGRDATGIFALRLEERPASVRPAAEPSDAGMGARVGRVSLVAIGLQQAAVIVGEQRGRALGSRWNAERDQAADFSAAKKEPSVIRC